MSKQVTIKKKKDKSTAEGVVDPVAAADFSMEEDELAIPSSSSVPALSIDTMAAQMQQMHQMMEMMKSMMMKQPNSSATSSSYSGSDTPEQPGTPRELELQAELSALKKKQADELAAAKKDLATRIFCSCTTGGCCTAGKPCNCTNSSKTGGAPKPCTARCGCRGISTICFNTATPGVQARLEKEKAMRNMAAVNIQDMSVEELEAMLIQKKKGSA